MRESGCGCGEDRVVDQSFPNWGAFTQSGSQGNGEREDDVKISVGFFFFSLLYLILFKLFLVHML